MPSGQPVVFARFVASEPSTLDTEILFAGNVKSFEFYWDFLLPSVFKNREFTRPNVVIRCTVDGEEVFTAEDMDKPVFELIYANCTIEIESNLPIIRGNAVGREVKKIVCPICTESGTDYELPGCRHRFHAKCLMGWVDQNGYDQYTGAPISTCPNCRGRIQLPDVTNMGKLVASDVVDLTADDA